MGFLVSVIILILSASAMAQTNVESRLIGGQTFWFWTDQHGTRIISRTPPEIGMQPIRGVGNQSSDDQYQFEQNQRDALDRMDRQRRDDEASKDTAAQRAMDRREHEDARKEAKRRAQQEKLDEAQRAYDYWLEHEDQYKRNYNECMSEYCRQTEKRNIEEGDALRKRLYDLRGQ